MPRIINKDGQQEQISIHRFERLKAQGAIEVMPHRRLFRVIAPPRETRISAGVGALASIGMSQVYTVSQRGKVNGHKYINPVDWVAFVGAPVFLTAEATAFDRSQRKLARSQK